MLWCATSFEKSFLGPKYTERQLNQQWKDGVNGVRQVWENWCLSDTTFDENDQLQRV